MGEVIHMSKRMNLVFTLLQIITVVIALIGTAVAVELGIIGGSLLSVFLQRNDTASAIYAILGLLTVIVVAGGSYTALYQFFTMCQRLKHGTAFTTVNEKAMKRIALGCGVSGLVLLVTMFAFLFCASAVLALIELMFLLSAAYLCIALVAYALALLLRRATAIQQENDLTI